MAGMNSTTFSSAIHTQYEKRLLTRALPRMLHAKWASEAHLSKANQYEVRKYGSLPLITTTLSEGVTPGEQDAPALTTVVLAPAWYGK